jgi:hypothetical protein
MSILSILFAFYLMNIEPLRGSGLLMAFTQEAPGRINVKSRWGEKVRIDKLMGVLYETGNETLALIQK